MKRYFIVFYAGISADHSEICGNLGVVTSLNRYINRKDTMSQIAEIQLEVYNKVFDIAITGINELTETDYRDFMKE